MMALDTFFSMLTCSTIADFKYGFNTDVNITVSVTRVGSMLLEVMCICLGVTQIYLIICVLT